MKQIRFILLILASILLLAACGADNNKTPETDKNTNQVEETNSNVTANDNLPGEATTDEDMGILMEGLSFTKIDLEVKYANDIEFEIELKRNDAGNISAEVEDEVHNVDLDNDKDAFNYIYPKVKDLSITQETPKEEVIAALLKAFDLPEDYHKFEAEFTFTNGTEIEFKDE